MANEGITCNDKAYPSSMIINLKEYVDSMFTEKEKALKAVADERDRAAEVLRDTTETAAAAVRAAADRVAKDNYDRLVEMNMGLRREMQIELSGRDTALIELKNT